MKSLLSILASMFVAGCSVVGQSNVDTAPYTLLTSDESRKIEVRNYESMVLVSASMSGSSGNSAFRTLFKYIGGENEGATEIAMTAPVIMACTQIGVLPLPDIDSSDFAVKPNQCSEEVDGTKPNIGLLRY